MKPRSRLVHRCRRSLQIDIMEMAERQQRLDRERANREQ